MNQINTKLKRADWLDVTKFIAIIAVMIDHTNGVLYQNQHIAYFSYYSVSLFIIVMGISTYWSYSNINSGFIKKSINKLRKTIRPYLVATFVYCITAYKMFDIETYLVHVIRFNASGPLYYVCLYIQLVIISPILYYILNNKSKYSYQIEIIAGLIIILISSLTTNYSNILSVYGGGGKLLGGNYLFLLYMGMLLAKYLFNKKFPIKILIPCTIVFLAATIAWWRFICVNQLQIDSKIPFGNGFNPPSISFALYSVLMALTIFFLGSLLSEYADGIPYKVFSHFGVIGRHTLYIFLYHRFFLDFVIPFVRFITGTIIENMWIKRLVYFIVMIAGSILLEVLFEKVHVFVVNSYKGNKNTV